MIIRKHTTSDEVRNKLYLASTFFFDLVVRKPKPDSTEKWFRKGSTLITAKDYICLPFHARCVQGKQHHVPKVLRLQLALAVSGT